MMILSILSHLPSVNLLPCGPSSSYYWGARVSCWAGWDDKRRTGSQLWDAGLSPVSSQGHPRPIFIILTMSPWIPAEWQTIGQNNFIRAIFGNGFLFPNIIQQQGGHQYKAAATGLHVTKSLGFKIEDDTGNLIDQFGHVSYGHVCVWPSVRWPVTGPGQGQCPHYSYIGPVLTGTSSPDDAECHNAMMLDSRTPIDWEEDDILHRVSIKL